MILVYITCKDKKEARKISEHLLKKRLIACANIFPIESMYRWKGKLVDENETVLICKSINRKFSEIKREVKKIHSYEIPCIEKIKTTADSDYEKWVKKEVELRTC